MLKFKYFRACWRFEEAQVSERQHLQFQGDPTPKPERGQRNYRRQDRNHAGHDKPVSTKLQSLQGIRNCEHAQLNHRAAKYSIRRGLSLGSNFR